MTALSRYYWPGNIRELQNIIERAVILSRGSTLQVRLSELQPAAATVGGNGTTLEGAEREHILRVLEETQWMVGSSMALLITLYLKRAEPNQLANTLSPAPARPVRSLPGTAQQFALSGTVSDLGAGRGCRGTGHVSDMEDER